MLPASAADTIPSEPSEVDRVWSAYQQRWASTATYTAEFHQTIEIDGIGGDVESRGRFYFSKPDRMRWDYTEGQDQRVVGDGSWMWVYQPDLEQVYKVDYRTAFGSGGLVALLADREGLAGRYEVALLDSAEGAVRLRLTPTLEGGEILELAMSADTFDLVSVMIEDPAGSVTQVRFAEVERNETLDENLFRFAPPDGVDIITTPTASVEVP